MSDPRYVIARIVNEGEPVIIMAVENLPDAEHVHVTRHPDGTITAVPMLGQPLGVRWCRPHSGVLNDDDDQCDIARHGDTFPEDPDECDVVPLWVDAPTENGGAA